MKAPDTHGAGDRRGDDVRSLKRGPRRTHSGTIGFGQVFSLVKGAQHGAKGDHGHGQHGKQTRESKRGHGRDE
ncbi:MAG: hypothetical protein H7123_04565, partial [Thermoleophilia bacterium]|nr:hypothetical protein [Thermoleophilia bacterium]